MELLKIKIGVDEAGRGPWAGPVVASAVAINPYKKKEFFDLDVFSGLTDSKKLTQNKKLKYFEAIKSLSKSIGDEKPMLFFGTGIVDNSYIDEYGIKAANKEAMARALKEILRKLSHHLAQPDEQDFMSRVGVIIDGNDNYSFDFLKQKPIYLVGGDSRVPEISAASVIAKVFRDELMKTYSLLYDDYGFETNAGYGVKKHKDALKTKADVTSIHRQSYAPIKKVLNKKPKILLHICCGPDATVPIMDLKKDYEVICFWYDPNIQPKKEYDKRLEAFKKVCKIEGVEWIEGEYDVKNFFDEIKGLESTPEKGEKCTKCYDMRLRRSAIEAKKLGIHYWTSTLNTSPHKDLEKMFTLGENHSLKNNLEFLKIAFRKNGGFQRSVDYTHKHGIYRQNYCGCVYSDTFPGRPGAKNKKGTFSG